MAKELNLHLFGAIEKFDAQADGSLMVSGIASTEAVDADGEIVTADAMRKALPSYLQCGTVREMHQPIAAGNPISAHVDDDGKTHFTAHIVDAGTIAKIKAGVLKGFSIGGKAIRKVGNKIEEILLKDISVVDLPNNPESFFTVIKFDKPGDKCSDPDCKNHTESAVKKCASCMEKTEKSMSAELLQKVDGLTVTVAALAKTVETLSKVPAPDLKKFEDAIGDLQKKATDAKASAANAERSNIISKIENEGRVIFNPETGIAYKADEIQKLDLNILKFAAKNSPQIPTQARAIFKGDSTPKIDPKLKGSDRIIAAFEKYDDLEKMQQVPIGGTMN